MSIYNIALLLLLAVYNYILYVYVSITQDYISISIVFN